MNLISRILYRYSYFQKKLFVPKLNNIYLRKFGYTYLEICQKARAALYQDKKILNCSSYSIIPKDNRKIVGYWLLTCSGMVFVAVILGGVTRLTESGLSMVSWRFFGEQMPIDETSWLREFEKYKQFPEFQISNKHISLEEFKNIWWMEYIHRMWGRLIGIAFVIPASYFWVTNKLRPVAKKKILLLGALIGCQGFMGWYMVKSGLESKFDGPTEIPRVSQYRLAAHLGLAFVIYSGLLYSTLDHLIPVNNSNEKKRCKMELMSSFKNVKKFRILALLSKSLIFLTALSGAFVAGLDAGLIYNTFPMMANKWIPDDILLMTPIIKNFTENPTMAQFNHRTLGMLTLSAVTFLSWMSRKIKLNKRTTASILFLTSAAYVQATLGILTLINHVPTFLAAMHQAGSLLVLSAVIWLCHELKYIKKLPK